MSKKRIIAIAILLITSFHLSAQKTDLYSTAKEWLEKPVMHQVPEKFKSSSAVYLLDRRIFRYAEEGKYFYQYNYYYRLIKVQDDKGIEMFNKIYIPIYANYEVIEIKARVITASGKVIDIPNEKIKEEEEKGKRYKLFAMEGLEKNAEIEYSYTVKKNATFFGSEIFQSENTPYADARLTVISPSHLQFMAKGYNGFNVSADSVVGNDRILPCYSQNIPELYDEKYAYKDWFLQRVDFKLSFNLSSSSKVELYTWKEFVRKAFPNLTNTSDKEKKALEKFMKNLEMPATAKEEKQIQVLEDYMKTKINVDDKLVNEGGSDIETIVKTGNATNFGADRLFIAMLEAKNIKYQIVFPSVRDQLPLDEEMANWNRIDETLIYFPSTGKYVQPSNVTLRYPYVEPNWAGTTGLYLKTTSIGDLKTAVSKFDTIPMEPFDQHAHNMEVTAMLDESGDSIIVESKQILTGYASIYYRPLWYYLPKDKQDDAVKEIIKSVAESENIQNIKVENTKLTDISDNKPLAITGTIHTAELLERAGNKLLFKVGELIGPQVQMYQEKPRLLPVQLPYAHVLNRILKFKIPANYIIKNADDIKIDMQYKDADGVKYGFFSTYKIEGDMLTIDVRETYRDINYPLSEFQTYQKVINASADFNKVVLVLEKK